MKTIACSLLILIAGFSFIRCKKETTQPKIPAIPADCPLCDYADSLEGAYLGLAEGPDVYVNTPDSLWIDSLWVMVEHIYQNLGTYEDSTVMFLKFHSKYNTQSDTSVRVIRMFGKHSFDYISDPDFNGYFDLTPEQMNISYFPLYFIGIRQ